MVVASERRVEGTSSSVLEVEEALLPRARELHHQLEEHLRGLGLPPVALEPAPQSDGNGSTLSQGSNAAGQRANGKAASAVEVRAAGRRNGHGVREGVGENSSSCGAAGSEASLERIQQHINGSSGVG